MFRVEKMVIRADLQDSKTNKPLSGVLYVVDEFFLKTVNDNIGIL